MKLIKSGRSRNCPWCNHRVGVFELLLLDEHSPRKCRNCGNFLKTSFVNSIISVVLPVVLFGIAVYLLEIDLLVSASLLLLIPVLRILLAEPIKYSLVSIVNFCMQCKRTNVKFSRPNSRICDKCYVLQRKNL